ncbi:MAG: hypothetical protein KDC11_06315 [Chitinophagaceae bacterium]|nr:hypothetical protein [Chitinophagaceae bacterium]
MKPLYLFTLVLLLASCDTTRRTVVHNNTNNEVLATVELNKHYIGRGAYPYIDSMPMWETDYNSRKFLKSHILSDTTYTIVIPPKAQTLLYPLNLGWPVKNVIIISEGDSLNCCYYVSKKEYKLLKEKGKVKATSNWNIFRDKIDYYIND